jgi:hypothetical protein
MKQTAAVFPNAASLYLRRMPRQGFRGAQRAAAGINATYRTVQFLEAGSEHQLQLQQEPSLEIRVREHTINTGGANDAGQKGGIDNNSSEVGAAAVAVGPIPHIPPLCSHAPSGGENWTPQGLNGW